MMTKRHHNARRNKPHVDLRLMGWALATCFALTALYALQPGYALLVGDRPRVVMARVNRPQVASAVHGGKRLEPGARLNNVGDLAIVGESTPISKPINRRQLDEFESAGETLPVGVRPDRQRDLVRPSNGSAGDEPPAETKHEELNVTASLANSLGGLRQVGRSLSRELHNTAIAVQEAAKPTLQRLARQRSLSQPDSALHQVTAAADTGDGGPLSDAETAIRPATAIVHNRAQGDVHFLWNSEVVSLAPGESRAWDGPGPWTIRFHRGADFGEATVTLHGGTYEFAVNDSGWVVQRPPGGEESRRD